MEKLPLESEEYDALINMYVTLDCNSIIILNLFVGQPPELRVINLS